MSATESPRPQGHPVATARTDSAVARSHWDGDAPRYVTEHADYLTEFYWCPERLTEDEAGLLGDIRGKRVLEVGAGTAACSEWVAQRSGFAVAQDISAQMLRRSASFGALRKQAQLVQSDVLALPFVDRAFDVVFSSFGALPFIGDLGAALTEIRRVLAPGGRCILASNHPMAWVFPDDPGPAGLVASLPYSQRVYEEFGEDNPLPPSNDPLANAAARTYAEYHHTVGDWVRAHAQAGLRLIDVIEPEWTLGTASWGQWSELRGSIFPGTAIFVSHARGSSS